MLLDTSSRQFEAIVAEADTTSALTYSVEYEDKIVERETPVADLGSLVHGSTNVIVPSPANNTRRLVNELHIHNNDTITRHVTLIVHDTVASIVAGVYYATLLTNQTLHYNLYSGWQIL